MKSDRKKIMLVDDDPSSRQQGRAILKDLYQVYPIPSAHKMLETLEVFTPDLILLDIKMPVVDGFDAIKRLKRNKNYAHIPVMFLTASNDKDSVVKGSKLGAAGFVTKPCSAADLLSHIENCLNPSAEVKHEKVVVLEAGGKSHEVEQVSEAEIHSDKPVVLAIDDAPDVLKSIHSILRDKYKVYTLPKPEKLHSILCKTSPDLILLDYKMPEISGFELIPLIRDYPEHKDTPIILLTSEGTIDTLTTAVDLGACDFIVKPVSMKVLRNKIEKYIT